MDEHGKKTETENKDEYKLTRNEYVRVRRGEEKREEI